MTKITENTIENFCIELLEKQGYEYIYAPDSDRPERNSYEDVLLTERLQNAIRSINLQIRTLESLRDTLLPKLMNGEIRVVS